MIMMMAIYCIRKNGVPIVTNRLSVQTTHSKGYFLFPTANLNGDTNGTVTTAVTAMYN